MLVQSPMEDWLTTEEEETDQQYRQSDVTHPGCV